jgi:hypothetical protein
MLELWMMYIAKSTTPTWSITRDMKTSIKQYRPCILLLILALLCGCSAEGRALEKSSSENCVQNLKTFEHKKSFVNSVKYFGNDNLWMSSEDVHGILYINRTIRGDSGHPILKTPWFFNRDVTGSISAKGKLKNSNMEEINVLFSPNETSSVFENNVGVITSHLSFPQEGCWELVVTKGNQKIRFATSVIYTN